MNSKLFFLTLFVILFSFKALAQVPAMDPHELAQSAKTLSTSVEDLNKEIDQTQKEIKQLTDFGSLTAGLMSSIQGLAGLPGTLLEGVLDINFLFPKISDDAKSAFPQNTEPDQLDQMTGGAASAAKGLVSGSEKNDKLPEGEEAKSIAKSMQVENSDDCVGSSDSDIVGAAQGAIGAVTGGSGVKKCPTGTETAAKRQQLGKSKQAFARFTLATGLVNRTLAYRTILNNKKETQASTGSADTIRKAHTTKTTGIAAMADTYNRLLFSQAVGNGLQAFKSMDQIEGRINLSVPVLPTGAGNALGSIGGILK